MSATRAACLLAFAAIARADSVAVARTASAITLDGHLDEPAWKTATVALLGAVALLATHIPARRAMKIDPLTALRQD